MTPREGSGDVELLGGRKGSPVLGLSVPVYLAHVNSVCVRNASFFYIIIMFYFIFFTGLGSTQKHFFSITCSIFFSRGWWDCRGRRRRWLWCCWSMHWFNVCL